MANPIKQVELQLALLKSLVRDNAPQLLPKMFGKLQQNFGGREWHSICAISSNAIINRNNTPKTLEERLVKSEFIADKLLDIMKLPASAPNALHFISTNVRPWFSEESLVRICEFLLEQNIAPATHLKPDAITSNINEPRAIYQDKSTLIAPSSIAPVAQEQSSANNEVNLKCKQCSNSQTLKARSGRYGYFVTCGECETNTPMKTSCPQCTSANTKVSKRKESYSLVCGDCENTAFINFKG